MTIELLLLGWLALFGLALLLLKVSKAPGEKPLHPTRRAP